LNLNGQPVQSSPGWRVHEDNLQLDSRSEVQRRHKHPFQWATVFSTQPSGIVIAGILLFHDPGLSKRGRHVRPTFKVLPRCRPVQTLSRASVVQGWSILRGTEGLIANRKPGLCRQDLTASDCYSVWIGRDLSCKIIDPATANGLSRSYNCIRLHSLQRREVWRSEAKVPRSPQLYWVPMRYRI